MADNVVGYATMPVIPSFAGFSGNLAGQISKPLAAASSSAAAAEGKKAGSLFGMSMGKALGAAGIVVGVVETFKKLFEVGQVNDEVSDTIRVGTGKSGAALEGLDKVAHQVSLSIPANLQSIAPVVSDLNDTLGLTGPILKTVTSQVLELGRETGTAVNVRDLSSTLAGFNITAAKTPGALDDILRVSQATDVPVNTLTGSLKTQGGILQSLGFNLTGAASFVGTLAKAGVNGNTVVRSLGAGLVRLAVNGEAPATTFHRIVGEINGYIKSGKDASALQLAGKVFGTRGASQFVAALKSGKINMDELTGSAGLSDNTILGLSKDTTKFAQNWQLIKNKAIDIVSPAANALFNSLHSGFSALTQDILRIPSPTTELKTPEISAVAKAIGLISSALTPVVPAAIDLGQAFLHATQSLGISIFQLLPGILHLIAGALNLVVPPLVAMADWLSKNQAIIILIVAAYASWKVITTVIGAVKAAQLAYTAATYGAEGATYANAAAGKVAALAAKAGAIAAAIQTSALWKGVAGWIANTAAVADNEALSVGSKVAIIASSVAMGIATAAQWLWNAAMDANPIGIIILAVAALAAGIIWLATKTTFFQDAWKATTTAISVAWNWLWTTILKPTFDAIGVAFTWIYNNIIKPVVLGIEIYISIWAAIFTWLWKTILQPYFNLIGAVFTWLYNVIILPIVNYIVLVVKIWAAIFTWLWANVLQPTFAAIGVIFTWIWNSIIKPIIGLIQAEIRGAGVVFTWLYQTIIAPAFAAIGAVFNWLWKTIISPVSTVITGAIKLIGSTVSKTFSGIGSFIAGAFKTALSLIKAPINGIIDLVNGVIGSIDKIHLTLPKIGSFGGGTLGFSIPKIPRLATGATVLGSSTGTLALLGEAGRPEDVVDHGLMNAALADLTSYKAGSNKGPDKLELYDVDGVLIGTMDVRAQKAVDDADDEDDSISKGRPR